MQRDEWKNLGLANLVGDVPSPDVLPGSSDNPASIDPVAKQKT